MVYIKFGAVSCYGPGSTKMMQLYIALARKHCFLFAIKPLPVFDLCTAVVDIFRVKFNVSVFSPKNAIRFTKISEKSNKKCEIIREKLYFQ
jgi:hypothetical protein